MLGWNEEIKHELGACGQNVFIGHNVMFARPKEVFLADNVRIDPFTLINCGFIAEGNNQISSHCIMNGRKTVHLDKWVGFGYRVTILTGSENFTGDYGPANDWFGENQSFEEDVVFNLFSNALTNSLVLPGTVVPEGAVIGANCVVTRNTPLKSFYVHKPSENGVLAYRQRNEKAIRQAVEDWKNEN